MTSHLFVVSMLLLRWSTRCHQPMHSAARFSSPSSLLSISATSSRKRSYVCLFHVTYVCTLPAGTANKDRDSPSHSFRARISALHTALQTYRREPGVHIHMCVRAHAARPVSGSDISLHWGPTQVVSRLGCSSRFVCFGGVHPMQARYGPVRLDCCCCCWGTMQVISRARSSHKVWQCSSETREPRWLRLEKVISGN
jgi:hypothetical protein